MVSIEADGSVEFSLRWPEARRVELVGTFEGWHECRAPMQRQDDGTWRLTLDPGPGVHVFRYLVDDRRWVLDQRAHGTCVGADGCRRSRLYRPSRRHDPGSRAA